MESPITLTLREFWRQYGVDTLETANGILNERRRVDFRPVASLSCVLLDMRQCCGLYPALADRITVTFQLGSLANPQTMNLLGHLVEADRVRELFPVSAALDGRPMLELDFEALCQRLQMMSNPEEAVSRTLTPTTFAERNATTDL